MQASGLRRVCWVKLIEPPSIMLYGAQSNPPCATWYQTALSWAKAVYDPFAQGLVLSGPELPFGRALLHKSSDGFIW